MTLDNAALKTPAEIGNWCTQAGMALMEAQVMRLMAMAPVTPATHFQRATYAHCQKCGGLGLCSRMDDDSVHVNLCSCLEIRRIDPV